MLRNLSLATVFIMLTVWLGYFVQQSEFLYIIGGYLPFFLLYLFICQSDKDQNIPFWIGVGILSRTLLLFSFPNLSDDIYRFVWDGRLIINGLNPFDQLPGYYLENKILPEALTQDLYDSLNSWEYYTIYPPVLQSIFALSTWLFPQSVVASGITMKLFLFLGEIGSIWLILKLLQHFSLPKKRVLLYILNPLIILEIMGNLHFEGLMIFFLLLAFWWLTIEAKLPFSALAMAGSVASKLLPLMFLPFLIARLGWRRSFLYFGMVGITLLLMFSPLLSGLFLNNFGASLDLYFRRFEFNASIFYVLKWFYRGVFDDPYAIRSVGPTLALISLTSITILAVVRRRADWQQLPTSWLFAISIYLLLTTTVHPWYICMPVALSVFTNWRYPIVWSAVIMLSYSHYWDGGFQERYGLIALEYVILIGFFLYEAFYLRKINPKPIALSVPHPPGIADQHSPSR